MQPGKERNSTNISMRGGVRDDQEESEPEILLPPDIRKIKNASDFILSPTNQGLPSCQEKDELTKQTRIGFVALQLGARQRSKRGQIHNRLDRAW
jgi:hypothetical protein